MKSYPALDIRSTDNDIVYVALDDFAPTAIEERGGDLRAFFSAVAIRDRARRELAQRFDVAPVDVADEDWARRSQQGLAPIDIGRIRVVPSERNAVAGTAQNPTEAISICIRPSMGFGTGHHATTRLCLLALQTLDVQGKAFLDLGTGSGILAIAAHRLGARACGIDVDEDAIQSAQENATANGLADEVPFIVTDLSSAALPVANVVAANLTGALLVRSAGVILNLTAPGGHVILSGLLRDERDDVCGAFAGTSIVWERGDEEWVGLIVKKP